MTLVRVRQEKLEAVFELEVVLYGDKYDAYRDALDGARMGSKTSYAPLTRALAICKRLKAASFKLDLSPEIVTSLEALLLHEAKDQEHAGIRLEEVKRGLAELGMELYPFQEAGIYFLASRRAALLSDGMGCVDGEAFVHVFYHGLVFVTPLACLFETFCWWKELREQGKTEGYVYIRGYDELKRELSWNPIEDVLERGVRKVLELTFTEHVNGEESSIHELRLTPDHEVLCRRKGEEGDFSYIPASELPTYDSDFQMESVGGVTDLYVSSLESWERERHVFDVVCAGPHRNFVANGIVVHNCGKTIQALTALPYRAPVLVVCPAVAKGVWKREAAKWRSDFQVSVLSGSSSFRWPGPGEIIVTNYDVLPLAPPQGATQGLSVVFDEAHYLKSFKSERRKASAKIAEAAVQAQGRVWLLTGTPLMNEPPELYSILDVAGLAHEAFGRFSDFVELFHGKEISFDKKLQVGEDETKKKATGRRKMVWGKPDDSVPERLARVMLRRLKRDVLPELPEKRVSVLEVEVTEDTLRELDKIAFTLEHEDKVNLHDPYEVYEATRQSRVVFERVATLRKLVASAKVPAALELAEEYEDENEPLIVASAHLEPLRAFEKRKGWAVIEGKTPAHLRTGMEDAFQKGELKGLACSIKAAGVALTLTRGCNMVFVDESWNPAENEQMEDRVSRLGQTRGVEIIRLFCDHELDKHVLRVLHRKEKMIARVVDAAAVKEAT